jgi:hypothetical protein
MTRQAIYGLQILAPIALSPVKKQTAIGNRIS